MVGRAISQDGHLLMPRPICCDRCDSPLGLFLSMPVVSSNMTLFTSPYTVVGVLQALLGFAVVGVSVPCWSLESRRRKGRELPTLTTTMFDSWPTSAYTVSFSIHTQNIRVPSSPSLPAGTRYTTLIRATFTSTYGHAIRNMVSFQESRCFGRQIATTSLGRTLTS